MANEFRSLFTNDQVQNFLQRHGLTTYGRIPLRKEEFEKRLQQIDDQSSVDLITQSLVEKALDIKRPLKKSTDRNDKQSIDHNPYVMIYDNSCAITMIYCGSNTFRNDILYTFKIQSDEIIIMQYQTNANSVIVYKSFLKPNDEFTFKSHGLIDTPFTIAIYINGIIDSRISTCCEQGYLKQRNLRSKRSVFQLLFVDGGTPCYTCQTNDLMDSSISDNEEAQSEWISMVNSNQITPSISLPTMSALSEPIVKMNSTKKDKIILSNLMSMDSDISSEMIPKHLTTTTTQPLTSRSDEIRTSTKVEKMIVNEETEKDLKHEDKVVNTVNQIIIQTEEPTSKQNQMKIANDEEEEEGQELISSIGTHEMLQLLSKYLSLLLPSSISNNQESLNTIQLIWLDATTDINEDTIISQTKLRTIINSLFIFHTIDETIHFIQNIHKEKVFLIISDSLESRLIQMNDLSQLDSIYIFCRNENKYKTLMEREYKIRGIFTDINSLCIRLKDDLKQILNDLIPISIASGISYKDKQKQVTFLCAQLHRELLLTMEYSDNARLDLIEYCANIYKDNETERTFIEEFKNEYHTSKAIWWYTRSTFLYKMLNTALFHQDIPILYKFHFFIKDLHMQIEQLHCLYKSSLESRTFTVYRGLNMSMKIFNENIRQEVNNLLSFDTFLSANLNKEIALDFVRNKINNDDESILFEIEIDTNKLKRPFVDISLLSEFKYKDEILFSIGTIFRIDHVAKEKTIDGIWFVHLSSIDENDKQLKNEIKQIQLTLLKFFKRVYQAQMKCHDQHQIVAISYINIANIYYKQNQYEKSLEFYQKALEISSSNPLTITIYQSNIAMIYMALNQQDNALKLYEEILNIRIKYCESNDPLLINTLHTIGDIYRKNKDFNNALKQYEKALEIQSISLKYNPSFIATTHINIALVYHQQNKINKALDHFLKALVYQRQYLSEYHPILAFLYNNISAMYYHSKNFDLALKNQFLTLKIEEHSLPKDHKTFAITYTNIAISYEHLKNYDQAIDYAQKAVNQLKIHLSQEHPDVQIKQIYLDGLLMNKDIFQDK